MGQCIESHRGDERFHGEQCLMDTTGQIQIWTQNDCERSKGKTCICNFPAQKRGNGTKISPPTKKLFQLITAGNRKVSFLHWGISENIKCINHTPGQAPCPKVVRQHKMYSMMFRYLFSYFYHGFLFIFQVFLRRGVERKGDRTRRGRKTDRQRNRKICSWVGGIWEGSERSWRRERLCYKHIVWKVFFK